MSQLETSEGAVQRLSNADARNATWQAKAGRLFRLMRKEISEILRDRRTIVTLVLMPVLLYPLLTLAFQQFFLAGTVMDKTDRRYRVSYLSNEEFYIFSRFLAQTNLPKFAAMIGSPATNAGAAPVVAAAANYPEMNLFGLENPAENLAELISQVRVGTADLGIRARRVGDDLPPRFGWEFFYRDDSPRGRLVVASVERRFASANGGFFESRLPTGQIVRVKHAPIHPAVSSNGVSMAALVPLILILMTITGAVYPAIDLTAGERERGTLEMLVAAPVPRLGLLFAKYVSVLTVALLTALINLVTMMVTLELSGMGRVVFGDGLSISTLAMMLGLLLLFASFFSAVLLSLTSFARSFKEAQAYLIPLMLLSLAPGLIGMMPGLRLQGLISVVPLLNIVLLGRDLFQGTADPATALVVVATTLLYAAAAIAVAARIFGAESVLYSEQRNWSDLFRRPTTMQPQPEMTGALLLFACLFPASFVMQRLLAAAAFESRLVLQVAGTALLFVVLPWLIAQWNRFRITSCFQTERGSFVFYLGAVLLGAALFPLIYEMLVLMRQAGWTILQPQHEQLIRSQIEQWRSLPPGIIVSTFVLTGVLEEAFFRGFLFSAFRAHTGKWTTILTTALLFGAFHFVFAFDRLLPSTLLGVVLGWVCWHARSVWPGVLLHACYNGLWVATAYSADGFGLTERHLPGMWMIGAVVVGGVGALLVWWRGKSPAGGLAP